MPESLHISLIHKAWADLINSEAAMFCKKGVLKNIANWAGKRLCWSLFLIKLHQIRPATLLKLDSNTDFFLCNF